MNKKISLVASILLFFMAAHAQADILGSENGGWSTYMGASTYFHNVQFESDSVGLQNEYYVEYTPNEDAVPVVVNGKSIWGTRTIAQAEKYMEENGLRPLAGINADYFSFTTGIPMGHTIIDGEIVSKEYGEQDAVGFRADGTAIIDKLDIQTSVSDGENKVDVMYINKWCQPGFDPIYLLTDYFGTSSKTSSECVFVICDPAEGRLHVDETMTVTVEDVFVYNGAIDIPKGKIILLADTGGNSEYVDFLSRCYAGEELVIANEAVDDDGVWNDIENAVSTVGGRLIEDGEVQSDLEAGAAPRTAVGIKEDGNVIFYTLDGRQPGHSYGAQLKTLAKRMAELGCVEAVNLDGGGSTVISAHFPGKDKTDIVNSPSDGYLRSVANFIFLQDNRKKSGIPWIVTLAETDNTNYLSGMSSKIEIESIYDTANYKMEEPYDLDFRAETDTESYIDDDGYIIFNGTGTVNIVMSTEEGGDCAEQLYTTFETPDEIKIFNQADWKEIDEITTTPSDELQLVLYAAPYIGQTELHSNNRLYTWETEGDIGTITEDGIFTLSDATRVSGYIRVSAGEAVKEIPVTITEGRIFSDTEGHWAEKIIDDMSSAGIINGMIEDGKSVFKPSENMTRAQYAAMIVNYLKLPVDDYADIRLNFTDSDEIPLWAKDYIRAACSEGIILGRDNGDGTFAFAPYDSVTRAEAMTVLGRILPDYDDYTVSFADADSIPQWAFDGVKKLAGMGIVNGYEDNTIQPLSNVTRAEAAAMLYKLQNR